MDFFAGMSTIAAAVENVCVANGRKCQCVCRSGVTGAGVVLATLRGGTGSTGSAGSVAVFGVAGDGVVMATLRGRWHRVGWLLECFHIIISKWCYSGAGIG